MSDDDLTYLGIGELGRRIRRREISALEATQAHLTRISALDGRLSSYARVMTDHALRQAEHADAELAAGHDLGPLHGVPLAVKDLCWTKDVPTAAGTSIHRDFRPTEDATVVRRQAAAGAVLLGKL